MVIISKSRKAVSNVVAGQTVLCLQMKNKVKMQTKRMFAGKQKRCRRIEACWECGFLKEEMRNEMFRSTIIGTGDWRSVTYLCTICEDGNLKLGGVTFSHERDRQMQQQT